MIPHLNKMMVCISHFSI